MSGKKFICKDCNSVFSKKTELTKHNTDVPNCKESNGKKSKSAMKSNLTALFDGCFNILRDDEVLHGDKALRPISYLIVLKLLEPHFGNTIDIDDYKYPFNGYEDAYTEEEIEERKKLLLSHVRFSNLYKQSDNNLPGMMTEVWDNILSEHPATNRIFLKGKGFEITKQSTYRKLIDKLMQFDFTNIEHDVLGDAYEDILKKVMTGKVLGQFFTPTLFKNFVIELVNPQLKADGTMETCGDPTMGTGGFLVNCLRYIMKQSDEKKIPLDWNFIKTKGLYGKEIEPDTYQLAMSNMIMSSGYMFEELERGDSIREPNQRKFDVVLSNPPFGLKGFSYDEYDYPDKLKRIPIKTNNTVSLFIQIIIDSLNINGRCGVILPDGKDLFGKSDDFIMIREYLMKTCDLQEVISLETSIFKNTSIKTCVLYFVKKVEGNTVIKSASKKKDWTYTFSKEHNTSSVKFYDYKTKTNNKTLLIEVPIERIVKHKYSLNFKEYMEKSENENINDRTIVMKTLGEVCEINQGKSLTKNNMIDGIYNVVGGGKIIGKHNDKNRNGDEFTLTRVGDINIHFMNEPYYLTDNGFSIKSNINVVNTKYIYYVICNTNQLKEVYNGTAQQVISKSSLTQFKIPIPSLEHQNKIVKYLDELFSEKYNMKEFNSFYSELNTFKLLLDGKFKLFQNLVDGYAQNAEFTKQIQFQKDRQKQILSYMDLMEYPVKTLGEVCEFKNGKSITRKDLIEGEYPVVGGGQQPMGYHNEYTTMENTILCSSSGAYAGYINKYNTKVWASDCFSIIPKSNEVINDYLYNYIKSKQQSIYEMQSGAGQPHVYSKNIESLQIPVPPLKTQLEIVKKCEEIELRIKLIESDIESNKEFQRQILTDFLNRSEDVASESNEESNEEPEEEKEEPVVPVVIMKPPKAKLRKPAQQA
jgi:type I restriction enzyme S subunit